MAMDFGSTKSNRCLVRGLSTDSPLLVLGIVKNSSVCLLDQNGPCEIACVLLLDMRSMNDV